MTEGGGGSRAGKGYDACRSLRGEEKSLACGAERLVSSGERGGAGAEGGGEGACSTRKGEVHYSRYEGGEDCGGRTNFLETQASARDECSGERRGRGDGQEYVEACSSRLAAYGNPYGSDHRAGAGWTEAGRGGGGEGRNGGGFRGEVHESEKHPEQLSYLVVEENGCRVEYRRAYGHPGPLRGPTGEDSCSHPTYGAGADREISSCLLLSPPPVPPQQESQRGLYHCYDYDYRPSNPAVEREERRAENASHQGVRACDLRTSRGGTTGREGGEGEDREREEVSFCPASSVNVTESRISSSSMSQQSGMHSLGFPPPQPLYGGPHGPQLRRDDERFLGISSSSQNSYGPGGPEEIAGTQGSALPPAPSSSLSVLHGAGQRRPGEREGRKELDYYDDEDREARAGGKGGERDLPFSQRDSASSSWGYHVGPQHTNLWGEASYSCGRADGLSTEGDSSMKFSSTSLSYDALKKTRTHGGLEGEGERFQSTDGDLRRWSQPLSTPGYDTYTQSTRAEGVDSGRLFSSCKDGGGWTGEGDRGGGGGGAAGGGGGMRTGSEGAEMRTGQFGQTSRGQMEDYPPNCTEGRAGGVCGPSGTGWRRRGQETGGNLPGLSFRSAASCHEEGDPSIPGSARRGGGGSSAPYGVVLTQSVPGAYYEGDVGRGGEGEEGRGVREGLAPYVGSGYDERGKHYLPSRVTAGGEREIFSSGPGEQRRDGGGHFSGAGVDDRGSFFSFEGGARESRGIAGGGGGGAADGLGCGDLARESAQGMTDYGCQGRERVVDGSAYLHSYPEDGRTGWLNGQEGGGCSRYVWEGGAAVQLLSRDEVDNRERGRRAGRYHDGQRYGYTVAEREDTGSRGAKEEGGEEPEGFFHAPGGASPPLPPSQHRHTPSMWN